MPPALKRIRDWTITSLVLSASIYLITSSHSFKSCVHEHKNDKEYANLKEGSLSVGERLSRFVRLQLGFSCVGDEKNAGTLVAIFAGLLTFCTLRLWATTGRVWEATERNAIAAKRAAETLPKLERAYVFMHADFMPITTTTHQTVINSATAEFELVNHGRTPAIVTVINFDFFVADSSMMNNFYYRNSVIDYEVVIPGGGKYPPDPIPIRVARGAITRFRPNIFNVGLSQVESDKIMRKESVLVVLGRVLYKDIFDCERKTGICMVYDGQYFDQYGGKDYNDQT